MTLTASQRKRPAAVFHGQSTAHAPAPGADDFVCDLIAIVRARVPGMTEEQAAAVDAEARARWGGDSPYIAKRPGDGRSARNESIRRDHRRGAAVPLLMRRYNLSRVTIWRIVGEPAGDAA